MNIQLHVKQIKNTNKLHCMVINDVGVIIKEYIEEPSFPYSKEDVIGKMAQKSLLIYINYFGDNAFETV